MKKKLFGFVSAAVALAVAIPGGSLIAVNAAVDGRPYTPEEDRMFDNLQHEKLLDNKLFNYVDATGEYSYTPASYLSVRINKDNDSPNAAIYKCAPMKNEIGRSGGLAIMLRSPDQSIKLKDLNLHYRGKADKDDDTLPVELDKALDDAGDKLPEITSDWQTMFIHAGNSTDNNPYINTYLGLHLVADPGVVGNLDIKYLYYADNSSATWNDSGVYQIEDFEGRVKVQQTPPHLKHTYWRFAKTGQIVSSALTLVDGSYAVADENKGNRDGEHENIVITARQGNITSISPIYGDKTNGFKEADPILWENLRDNNNAKLGAISSYDYKGFIINFFNSGIKDRKISGIRINGKGVSIHNIFFSSVPPLIPAFEYPRLDPNSRRPWDDFNRDEVGVGKEGEFMQDTPVATQHDLYWITSYFHPERLSMENGALVFEGDGTNDTVVNYKASGCRVNNGAYQYVVFKMKGTDGANLDNFRFTTIDDTGNTTDPVYKPDLYSDVQYGIPELGAKDYPYVTADGWTYIIVDIKLSGFPKVMRGFDLYYSGAGKLYIDEIFYAGRAQTQVEYKDVLNKLVLLNDETKPTVEYELNETIKVGDKVSINPTVTDNLSAKENIETVIKVKHNGKYITLDETNSFTAQTGKYVIIILAIDEANNVNTIKLFRNVK